MKKIAILTWGPGFERNIALKSVKLFEKYIHREYETFILPESLDEFISRRDEFEKVIPVFHWEYGEDGRIQALLDIYNIPYIGSSYFVNALCMNKKQANAVAAYNGLNIPQELYLSKWSTLKQNNFSLNFPVILKPNTGGSSYYTYKIADFAELEEKIKFIWENISDDLLIQEYILWDEYSISVVNGEVLDAIMFVEKNNAEDFFDYESKYESESGMRETFPDLNDKLKSQLIDTTQKAIDIFDVQWYARVDFIVRDNVPYFLEVNTIPGSTEVSIVPKAWKLSGRTLEEFIEVLLW
jgi:D-alanine-D-alanine ligase